MSAADPTDRSSGRLPRDPGNYAGQPPAPVECCHEGPSPKPSSVRPERRGRGPGVTGLVELLERLSPRDLAVLQIVGDHRFLTTAHVQGFCFHDHASLDSAARTARRVLARLQREQLLERPARRVGGLLAGSAASTWTLTSTGQRLLSLRAGHGAVGRARVPGERFIAHHLAIADAHLAIVTAERAGQLSVAALQLEPGCWRNFVGAGGSREVLKPDLAAVTSAARDSEYEDHWFIEIDRATESLPTLIRQCRAYEAYRRSDSEQAARGVFPLVVWVVPTERRAGKLRTAIAAARGLDAGLYRVTTPDGLLPLLTAGGPS